MIPLLIVIVLVGTVVSIFMRQPQFGKPSSGERLQRIQRSPHYRQGQFQNLSPTPSLAEGESYGKVMRKFFFGKDKRVSPASRIPSVKTDLFSLPLDEDVLVWFGHSSYYLHLAGKRILVDPVLSGAASPVSFTTRSFPGSDVYTVDDIPPIDCLLITHDHYDHLDYRTASALQSKVSRVVTGLGVGAHLEHWGYSPGAITELDWDDQLVLDPQLTLHAMPARHFSGRKFKRNQSLWLSFVLSTPETKLFVGGDSGYDTHFAEIGERFGPFDLVILENGQYNESWRYIHAMPEEVVQAALDLRARRLLPVHWAKFALSIHAWDEPIRRVMAAAKSRDLPVVHPVIGEPVYLKRETTSRAWWENLT